MPMRERCATHVVATAVVIGALAPATAAAQLDRIGERVVRGVADEIGREAENRARDAVRCAFNDLDCIEDARRDGQEPVLTDEKGQVLTREDGQAVTDREEAAARAGALEAPGTGAWTNYDFVPGERVLYADDFAATNVGDFPRSMTFVSGSWDVVEWQGTRMLRCTGGGRPTVEIELPEALPERFTIELEAYTPHGNSSLHLAAEDIRGAKGNAFRISAGRTGVVSGRTSKVQSIGGDVEPLRTELTPIRIMVDGQYAKVYMNEQRVANVPNAQLERSRTLRLQARSCYPDRPVLVSNLRVAAGGRDLYDVLAAEGRVATQGIYFATNSAVIRPESTPTLEAIADMLEAHDDLRLSIEGHTDSDGDEAANLELSRRRAAAVKTHLVQAHGIDAGRLEAVGHGESKPAADNATPAGKQQNRRVELVKVSG